MKLFFLLARASLFSSRSLAKAALSNSSTFSLANESAVLLHPSNLELSALDLRSAQALLATGAVRTVTSNTEGFFQFRSLPTGGYDLIFELAGFRSVRSEGVLVEAAVNRPLNVTMEVDGVEETVIVTADAELLQTDTPAVSYQVSSLELAQPGQGWGVPVRPVPAHDNPVL